MELVQLVTDGGVGYVNPQGVSAQYLRHVEGPEAKRKQTKGSCRHGRGGYTQTSKPRNEQTALKNKIF